MRGSRLSLPIALAWSLLLAGTWGMWLCHLDASALTFDEAATYFIAHRPLMGILAYLRGAVREHPPLYYLLIHGWMALAGSSEFSLRIFSVGGGVIAAALTGWVARQTRTAVGATRGLLPALFLAATPGMAYYAREARMYSLSVVWTMLSAGLFLRDWLPAKGWPRRMDLLALVALHLLALFTHYYLLLPILVQPLVLLISRRWRPLLAWCGAHGFLALVGLVWLRLAPGLQATVLGLGWDLTLTVPTRFQVFHLLGKILFSPVLRIRFHLLYWLLALAGTGVVLVLWHRRSVGVWLALVLLLPPALAFQMPHPPVARLLIPLIPLLALAMGSLGTAPLWLRWRWLAWGATSGLALGMICLLVAGGLYQAIAFDRSHYDHTLGMIKAHARSGDGFLLYGPWQLIQFEYYDPGDLPPITVLPPYAPPHLEPAEAEPVLEELLTRYERLWVIPAAVDDVDPAHFVEGWLHTHAHAVWETGDFSLYLPPLPPDAPSRAVQTVFGEALLLKSVAWEPQPVRAGEPIRLTLRWSPLRRLENDVRLVLRLTDASEHVWAEAQPIPGAWAHPPSQWEPGEAITDYEGLMIPQGAPPGEYTVRLGVEGSREMDLLTLQVSEPDRPPVLYGLPNPAMVVFCSSEGADCLTLAGYEPGGLRFQQGHSVLLTLHWLYPRHRLPELHLRLRVVRRPWLPGLSTTSVVTRTFPLVTGYSAAAAALPPDAPPGPFRVMLPLVACASPSAPDSSTATSPPDRLVTLPIALTLPSDAPTGPAQVTLEVLGADGTPWTITEGRSVFPLFNLTIEQREALRRLPWGIVRVQADFGDEVGLRGYRIEGHPRPGGELRLTYYWYARARPTAIYAVFNHLMTADGNLVTQADGWPQEGCTLTIQWQPGDYIEDHYTLAIPADAPPGAYWIYVGLYDAATGERLPAFQNGQRLADDRLPIPVPDEERQ